MAGGRHRAQDDVQILAGEAEGRLAQSQALGRAGERLADGGDLDSLAQPGSVGRARSQIALQLLVREQLAASGFDGDHLTWTEHPVLGRNALGQIDEPDLRCADGKPVGADEITKWAQAVSVEPGADHSPVGEDDPRRPVPGLEQAGVIAVEVAHPVVQLRIAVPGLGHQHGQRVAHVTAAAHEQLEHVVERA